MITPLQLDLERSVRAYVAAATGLLPELVIPANDNHPAPNIFYATVLFMNRQPQGLGSLYSSKGDGVVNYKVRWSRIVNFSVNFYRSQVVYDVSNTLVYDAAEALIGFADTPLGQNVLSSLGLVFNDAKAGTNVVKLMSDEFEPRAQVDLAFSVSQLESQVVPSIVSADIEILENSGNAIIEDTVSVQI